MLPSIEFRAKDRLSLLRRLDRAHRWQSLRDQRYCTHCHTVFDGREVDIVGGTRAAGPLRLQCPGPRCGAAPVAWLRAIDDKAVADGLEGDALILSHRGRACTFRRPKRAPRAAGIATGTQRDHWIGLRHATLSLLHLLPASLQQGRLALQHLRGRAG
jgi:hypothetical protein